MTIRSAYIPSAVAGSYPVRDGNKVEPLIDAGAFISNLSAAVDRAQHRVWATVAFFGWNFQFGDRRSLFELLHEAVARGVDVRLLVWRPNPEAGESPTMFRGSKEDRERLRSIGSRVKIRWDRAIGRYCQHQKSWIIDAGFPSEVTFVGGANITVRSTGYHDVHLELAGPSATDVHHNFVQRWNEASERNAADGNWACDSTFQLPLPKATSRVQGTSTVQIQRMIPAGQYVDGSAASDAESFDIGRGERSISEQYIKAIDAARRTIYLENQAIPVMEIAAPLARALARGVDVALLVPSTPEPYVFQARLNPAERGRFEGVELLASYPNFVLSGLTGEGTGDTNPLYVHSKLMIVDDRWCTVGSCNLHAFSLNGHCEMNASVWDADVAQRLRRDLFARHLGKDCVAADDRGALRQFREAADENRRKQEIGAAVERGRPIALAARSYGYRA